MDQAPDNLTLGHSVTDWARLRPNHVAFVDGARRYTWLELDHYHQQVINNLKNQGVESGDTLAVIGKNHGDLLWLFIAAQQLALRMSFVAPGPAALIEKKLHALCPVDSVLWVYDGRASVTRESDTTAMPPWAADAFQLTRWPAANTDEAKASIPPLDPLATPIATLTFTSGSMGTPKIVAHSHQQHFASARGLLSVFCFTQNDCWLLSLPLYHVSGLAILYRWLLVGACLKMGSGNLEKDRVGVSHASLVPVQLSRLLAAGVACQTLTHVLLGGSHIPHSLCQQAEQQGIETWLGYGMTEAASTVTAKRANQTQGVGAVLPLRQVKVEQQRIYIGGETLALGYYEQGRVTPLPLCQGWYDSQDLGDWREGELFVSGRADNMFISGGENIHCEDIEAALLQHPDIEVAVVLAVMDREYGARPIAVIRSLNSTWNQEDIESYLVQTLDKYKWPIAYFPLPDEWVTQGIKLSRHDVKAWFGALDTNYLVMS